MGRSVVRERLYASHLSGIPTSLCMAHHRVLGSSSCTQCHQKKSMPVRTASTSQLPVVLNRNGFQKVEIQINLT
jgi:hypothetical protein